MALALDPEFGIEVPDDAAYMDLKERVEAAVRTINELEDHGLEFDDPDDVDNDNAAALVTAYAENVEKTSKAINHNRFTELTPAVIVQTNDILKEFGHLVATHSAEIRNTVVNKLILETENADARIRIKALELLGKMTDVGLFTERKEITVTHQNAAEIREKLREKLTTLKQNAEGVYEEVKEEGSKSSGAGGNS